MKIKLLLMIGVCFSAANIFADITLVFEARNRAEANKMEEWLKYYNYSRNNQRTFIKLESDKFYSGWLQYNINWPVFDIRPNQENPIPFNVEMYDQDSDEFINQEV